MSRRTEASTRRALLAKLQRLRAAIPERASLGVEPSSDTIDEAQWRAAFEATAQKLNNDVEISEQIESALDRIEQGEYGICEECGEKIPSKRLRAIPWVATCLPCQEQFERDSAWR